MLGDRPIAGFAEGTMAIFNPKKSVIVDMVMVQLLSIILTLGTILVTGANTLDSNTVSYLVAGLFGSFMMLGGIYSRLASI